MTAKPPNSTPGDASPTEAEVLRHYASRLRQHRYAGTAPSNELLGICANEMEAAADRIESQQPSVAEPERQVGAGPPHDERKHCEPPAGAPGGQVIPGSSRQDDANRVPCRAATEFPCDPTNCDADCV